MKIYQKLIAAKSKFPDIVKNVSGFGYKYANLSQVIEAISEPLWNEKLDFYQTVKEGKMQTGVIDCETGDKIELVEFEVVSATIAKSTDIQALGGGITYIRRYSLMLAFGLGVEDDDGANKDNKKDDKRPFTGKAPRPEEQALIVAFNTKKQLVPAEHTATLTKLIANISTVSVAKLVEWTNWLNSLRPAVNDMQPNANTF